MTITQRAQVDIATRPECSQNWDQVFVECDTTGFWQARGISKDRDGQKKSRWWNTRIWFLKCNQAEVSEADASYHRYYKLLLLLVQIWTFIKVIPPHGFGFKSSYGLWNLALSFKYGRRCPLVLSGAFCELFRWCLCKWYHVYGISSPFAQCLCIFQTDRMKEREQHIQELVHAMIKCCESSLSTHPSVTVTWCYMRTTFREEGLAK